jgi:hypothetical protein
VGVGIWTLGSPALVYGLVTILWCLHSLVFKTKTSEQILNSFWFQTKKDAIKVYDTFPCFNVLSEFTEKQHTHTWVLKIMLTIL